ncbi:MAG TPA: glycosyltransferase family 9 protein, partial [Gemmatimonadaceae bacterium]
MAQTWTITRPKLLTLKLVDTIGFPAFWVARRLARGRGAVAGEHTGVKKILVVELWHIGDVVLATAALRLLRRAYPNARITLLAKPYAAELLAKGDLIDELVVFDFPWTALDGKYDPRRYEVGEIGSVIAQLRREKFDLSVDVRMDLRSNLLTYAIGARRRVGYDLGGGSRLLTDAVRASPDTNHKVLDWVNLLLPVLPESITANLDSIDFAPLLQVSADEIENARTFLGAHGIRSRDTIVGLHAGASVGKRRWPAASFAEAADTLAERYGTKTLLFVDPHGVGADTPLKTPAVIAQGTLREFMALVSQCDLFICNDSGPMHIADALGVRVVGVFTTGNPLWHRPYREGQRFVGRGTGSDFIDYPTVADV